MRTVVAATTCHGGEVIFCGDGATFFSFPDGIKPRELIEGTPVPGTLRDTELREQGTLPPQNRAASWEAVARNLAQLLNTAADDLDAAREGKLLNVQSLRSAQELRIAYRRQCDAHGVQP